MTVPQANHASALTWAPGPSGAWTLRRPYVMAILNVTPDSFSDGGRFASPESACAAALHLIAQGADMLDIGGESTRPGAPSVSEDEQIRRVIPVIAAIRAAEQPGQRVPISVDTTRARVAAAAIHAGADVINDVSAGTDDPDLLPLAARSGAGLILMHRAAAPADDRYSDRYECPPDYADVTADVLNFLARRLAAAAAAGVHPERILLDPGLGFGKSVEQNLTLIRDTPRLLTLGRPILSGLSRKSFVGRVGLARDSTPLERGPATLGLSVAHLASGARVFRVHDVREHAQALRAAWNALSPDQPGPGVRSPTPA